MVFYRSYKVHLSIKKGSKTTILYTYSYDKVSKNALFDTYLFHISQNIPFIHIICRSSHLFKIIALFHKVIRFYPIFDF